MDAERVIVPRDNVSPLEAKIVQTYFVDKCNDRERANMMFVAAESHYNEATNHMVVEAELSAATSPAVGRLAVERAFQFAEDMLAS